jgi:SAM-dependent methyltransferase
VSSGSYPDARERFGDRADDYARYRPAYPHALIDVILDGFATPEIADLGAGTGISARLLAAAGARVYAIEPNEAMRSAIERDDGIVPVAGSAESTGLPPSTVDLVTAFQAYHWFNVPALMAESRRITRARARFAAIWNQRDLNDAFSAAYERVIAPYDASAGKLDRERRSGQVAGDLEAAGWRDVRMLTFPHVQPLDWDALLGFSRSASYLPREGDAHESLRRDLRALYDRWTRKGLPAFCWIARAYLAERYE